ncbi:RNA polymerase factor sigma-54 [Pediococcus inopinatus]|uniref:RNA polymerase factor sigma-54 n=1 Tax=Pediococcus inopinatus TaxID=114090 RepID=A0ABZ0Q2U8_9LACO|nr:RNA polymerase factor sigma-54 [Pediococcus inopinatus]WPC19594.1 RNA polymerase factor sigma-54 [Pediococcus inopinatus]WPC21293.1 RNA polymerase factor sigma-54 [Pediococcus inopinatus]WPP09765.1 RNA polymerase factor sigma-54 [Pediococcus inopinatus]
MAIQQGLHQHQKQAQRLAMTQTLQQSIQVLQYNVEELQNFLNQKALENPLINVSTSREDLPISSQSRSSSQSVDENYMNQIPNDSYQSLFEYLLDQIHLTLRDTPLRNLVLFLLEYIDQDGYLDISLEDAMEKTGSNKVDMVDAVTLIQQLDPPGVGARNLQESLLLQAESDDWAPKNAITLLKENFEELANKKWALIAKQQEMTLAEIQEIFDYIRTLTPKPGARFNDEGPQYIFPDLIVENEEGELSIRMSRSAKPAVHFQQRYFQKMLQRKDSEVTDYVKGKKKEYDWISRSLQQRENTILRVGRVLVEHQQAFFLEKTKELRPLLLQDVALKLGLHESTISRAVNGKYLQTRFGTFELKSFFSSAVAKTDASPEGLSVDTVKQLLQKFIHEEDKRKPLSDAKIVKQLAERKIEVSRRTVAKYRESLNIPSSSARKRYEAD